MRMGQPKKSRRSKAKKPALTNPNAQDPTASQSVIVGQLSSNLIESIFVPQLDIISTAQQEQYAEAMFEYDEAMKALINETDNTADNQEPSTLPQKPNANSYLYASTFESEEFFRRVLDETSKDFTTIGKSVPQWKVRANAAKFERHLDEKYGRLRPFITQHPEIEVFFRNVQRKLAKGEFSPLRQGDPPMDLKASIMLLFILQRNGVKMEALTLAFLFLLVGLQTWALVLIVSVGWHLFEQRKKKKMVKWLADEVKPTKPYYASKETESTDAEKHAYLSQPVGEPISPNDFINEEVEGEETYNTIMTGSGPATLYTAALLARTGKTVLVLSHDKDASGVQMIEGSGKGKSDFTDIPFDIGTNNVAHVARQQMLLAPALCNETDTQGGIRFARIGSEVDGFTSDILSIPGMGANNNRECLPFPLRTGGIMDIAQDAATFLGDGWPGDDGEAGDSLSAAYIAACAGVNESASDYYISKMLPENINNIQKDTAYEDAGVRYASSVAEKLMALNAHTRSLVAGMGLRSENLPPSKASMATHVSNICAFASSEGFHYPVGGPRALCHALTSVIEQNGGKVLTSARVKEYMFKTKEEEEEKKAAASATGETKVENTVKPRCHGVKLTDGRAISVGTSEDSCVISMNGFIQTFIFNMPPHVRDNHNMPSGLPALTERRPLIHFLFGLRGNSEELSLTGADWYRLPNASLARDEVDQLTGEVKLGVIGSELVENDIDDDTETENNDNGGDEDKTVKTGNRSRDKRSKSTKSSKKVKFDAGSSWMKVSFPSAKDPSWKERHGDISTCVVTIEADDDFVKFFDVKPQIFSNIEFDAGVSTRLLERVKKDLLHTFPQLEGQIESHKMIGPVRVGLSHTPHRYAAKCIKPVTPYPGLFVGGPDLTIGDSFSASIVGGWMAANAVLGYNFVDHLYLEKNITNDLKQYLKYSSPTIEDVAVPYKNAVFGEQLEQKEGEGLLNDCKSTAESTKEE